MKVRQRDPYGCYRSLEPPGVLPQNAWKLDNDPEPFPGETRVAVEILNVDSSSFRQLAEQSWREGCGIEELVMRIVVERGKLHNPVTGSGGMLLGSIDSDRRIATLVSLALTPLKIDRVLGVDRSTERVYVEGTAILFEQTLFCELPSDLDEKVVLSVLDVAGAPARCASLCRNVGNVLIMGAGKAGFLVAAAIRKENPGCRILAVDAAAGPLETMAALRLCDWFRVADCRRPLELYEAVSDATGNSLCDLTVNVVNQPDTEGASILATREGGMVYFFSMATSFSRAALTAEGVARDVNMQIGSGYTRGWTDYALGLLRENAPLRDYFEKRYGG